MKRLWSPPIILFVVFTALGISKAFANSTADWVAQKFEIQQAIRVALLVRAHGIEQALNSKLASYHPLPFATINRMTDVNALRLQVIAAQQAAQTERDLIAANLTPAQVQANVLNSSLTNALATAITAPQLPQPFTYGVGGTRVLAVYDSTSTGTAPAVSPTISTACNVMSYVTGAFGTGGPQFISSTGQTTGQKNTLSIVGFALGIVPIAMNCTKDHSTTPAAGHQQQVPQQ